MKLEGHIPSYIGTFGFARKIRHTDNFSIRRYYDCKEIFTNNFDKNTRYISIIHSKLGGEDCLIREAVLITFINDIEKQLNLLEEDKLELITFDNNKTCVVIKTSKWWRKNRIRREFLAVMLQNASKWSKSRTNYNFKETLYSGYAGSADKAVDRFLNGRTHYFGFIGGANGWRRCFRNNKNLWKMW